MSDEHKKNFALTTVDNPYNPFDQFAEWHMWDIKSGYNTCAVLSDLASVSDDFPDDGEELLYQAMLDLVDLFNGKHYVIVEEKLSSDSD